MWELYKEEKAHLLSFLKVLCKLRWTTFMIYSISMLESSVSFFFFFYQYTDVQNRLIGHHYRLINYCYKISMRCFPSVGIPLDRILVSKDNDFKLEMLKKKHLGHLREQISLLLNICVKENYPFFLFTFLFKYYHL